MMKSIWDIGDSFIPDYFVISNILSRIRFTFGCHATLLPDDDARKRLAEAHKTFAEPSLRLAEAHKTFAEPSLGLAEAHKTSAEPSLRLAEAHKTFAEPSLRLAEAHKAFAELSLRLLIINRYVKLSLIIKKNRDGKFNS
jgi:hypothetical protein